MFLIQDFFYNISIRKRKTNICNNSEKLVIDFGLLNITFGTTNRIVKNLRVCGYSHFITNFLQNFCMRNLWRIKMENGISSLMFLDILMEDIFIEIELAKEFIEILEIQFGEIQTIQKNDLLR